MNSQIPDGTDRCSDQKEHPLLSVRRVTKYYRRTQANGFARAKRFAAAENVSFDVGRQKVIALVGESGAGKSTVAKIVLDIINPDSGRIYYNGADLHSLNKNGYQSYRRGCQAVFQDPKAALSPRMRVIQLLEEPLIIQGVIRRSDRVESALTMLEKVGLGGKFLDRLPHELSGGEAQRINIARALLAHPQLLVCDEPTANLDVFIEARIMNLLFGLIQSNRLSLLFITHNIRLVQDNADEIAVMYAGRVVEKGAPQKVITSPLHPYTEKLMFFSNSPPTVGSNEFEKVGDRAEISEESHLGCCYAAFCPQVFSKCYSDQPQLVRLDYHRHVACWKHTKK